jgi:hypothetical protein
MRKKAVTAKQHKPDLSLITTQPIERTHFGDNISHEDAINYGRIGERISLQLCEEKQELEDTITLLKKQIDTLQERILFLELQTKQQTTAMTIIPEMDNDTKSDANAEINK